MRLGPESRGRAPTNIVDVYVFYVAYLRRKLETLGQVSLIRSVRGIGYELAVPHHAPIPARAEPNVSAPPPSGRPRRHLNAAGRRRS